MSGLKEGHWCKDGGHMVSGLPAHAPCSCLLVLLGLNPRHSISILLWTAAGPVPLYDLVSLTNWTNGQF